MVIAASLSVAASSIALSRSGASVTTQDSTSSSAAEVPASPAGDAIVSGGCFGGGRRHLGCRLGGDRLVGRRRAASAVSARASGAAGVVSPVSSVSGRRGLLGGGRRDRLGLVEEAAGRLFLGGRVRRGRGRVGLGHCRGRFGGRRSRLDGGCRRGRDEGVGRELGGEPDRVVDDRHLANGSAFVVAGFCAGTSEYRFVTTGTETRVLSRDVRAAVAGAGVRAPAPAQPARGAAPERGGRARPARAWRPEPTGGGASSGKTTDGNASSGSDVTVVAGAGRRTSGATVGAT